MCDSVRTRWRSRAWAGRGRLVAAGLVLAMLAAPIPSRAQESDTRLDMEEFKRRLDEAWDEMMRQLGPTIDRFSALLETLDRIDSLDNYESPEVMPNGDIVIRRKPDAPPLPEVPAEPGEPADGRPGIRT